MNTPIDFTVEERIELVRWALSQIDRDQEPKRWHVLISTLGGLTTLQRYGVRHFVSAGRIGFYETVRKHWKGNRDDFIAHLHARASISISDREMSLMIDLYVRYRPDLVGEGGA